MKKILSFITALSILSTVNAGIREDFQPPVRNLNLHSLAFHELQRLPQNTNRVKGLRKIDGQATLEGDWNIMLKDWYFEDSVDDGVLVVYKAEVDGTTVTFTPKNSSYQKMVAEYNPENSTLIFSKVYIGLVDGYHTYQQPFVYNYNTKKMDYQDITGWICLSDDSVIYFNPNNGIDWHAYQYENGTGDKGYLDIYDLLVCYKEPSGEWKNLGNAQFMDGWLIPGYGENQEEYIYEVPLQQNTENPNLYRLVNPYKYGPLAEQNTCTSNGYIMFDVTDPKHVIFKLADAGFQNDQAGISHFYAYNWLGWLCYINSDYYADQIIEALGNTIAYTKFENGIVSLTSGPEGKPDCRFGVQFDPIWGQYWSDETGTIMNMNALIIFPGADGVGTMGVDNSEAPVEYFNLQGVRVSNPESGQVVIRRQGSEAVKVVM